MSSLDGRQELQAKHLHHRKRAIPGKPAKDYSPISAAGYFSSALEVDVPLSSPAGDSTATFRVYYTPPRPTEEDEGGRGIVFVCVHGAGYSGLSYAAFGKALAEKGEGKVGVLAYDARGHGESALLAMRTAELRPSPSPP